ncbi:peptide chain release factor N(5)-glutamine methyltransferase [Lacimicrobium alkaliphilum]|nr:peptide chain release factor N(5)-glutamine methyltransferase [Lacimicrobium alkaliphilum]
MTAEIPTLASALSWAKKVLQLSQPNDADATIDSKALLSHCLQKPAVYLHTWPERTLSKQQWQAYQQLIEQRKQGVPVAHLTGERGFWSLSLQVSPKTLIPRADTEVLVEKALSLFYDSPLDVLDLGTGTGAIALALASERPHWQLTATDFDADIVELARVNARRNNIANVHIMQSDWFAQLEGHHFSLIVSNPPYVEPDSPFLEQGDVRFEPLSALVAEQQGMAALEHIIAHAGKYLLDAGWLVLEHGFQQAQQVRDALLLHGFTEVGSERDYAGLERITFGKWLKKK